MDTGGIWQVQAVEGAEVRLRSKRIGLVSVDVKAPVRSGELRIVRGKAQLSLAMALDQLSTGNFIMQAAARTLVKRHGAGSLVYEGQGRLAAKGRMVTVAGMARAGDVEVAIDLLVTPVGPNGDPMLEIELTGSASIGRVHLPLPGLGTIDDFSFDVDARLALRSG